MYEFAYSAICDELPTETLPPNCLRLADAIELLDAAGRPGLAPHQKLQLLSDFRRLWLAIANELLRDCQDVSPETIAEIRTGTSQTLAEIERRRFERSTIGGETELLLL